jgi:hypothetical protein
MGQATSLASSILLLCVSLKSVPLSLCLPRRKLGLPNSDKLDLSVWKAQLADRWDSLVDPVRITLIGE